MSSRPLNGEAGYGLPRDPLHLKDPKKRSFWTMIPTEDGRGEKKWEDGRWMVMEGQVCSTTSFNRAIASPASSRALFRPIKELFVSR